MKEYQLTWTQTNVYRAVIKARDAEDARARFESDRVAQTKIGIIDTDGPDDGSLEIEEV